MYRALISAQDAAPGLQFYEFESPREKAQIRLEAWQVITKFLPWNSNMFIEISIAQSIVQRGPSYFCVYAMDRAHPVLTTELLNGEDPATSALVFEALAFNTKCKSLLRCSTYSGLHLIDFLIVKYFALAYRYGSPQKRLQAVQVYSFKDDNSVELVLDERVDNSERSINFPDISMAISGMHPLIYAI